MKCAHQDLQESGASAPEIAQATADWMVQGHKTLIEEALATLVRLASRSSLNQAENERASLEDVRLPRHGELVFAATYFAPISAVAQETWMEAQVSLADLDRAVGNAPESARWKAYLGNRSGEVSFEYVVINCLRPWYSPELYRADDWRLSSEATVVSKGNGSEGLLPAYVDAVYLVSVKNVIIPPRRPPTNRAVLLNAALTRRTGALQVVGEPKSLGDPGPRSGVVRKATNDRFVAATATAALLRRPSVLAVARPAAFRIARNSGAIRTVTPLDVSQRYTLAHAYLSAGNQPIPIRPEAPTSPPIYVAGFGCEKVPFAPNPNVNYRWLQP